jgi:lipoate-protein ligase A
MTLQLFPYDLPDAVLFNDTEDGLLVWQPARYYIVLGQSNTIEGSLFITNVIKDGITVTKRPTGGEAVVLAPSMVVITLAKVFSEAITFKTFFSEVNDIIIESLKEAGIIGLGTKGISDITIGNRKILGSSMRCHGNRMVYHAVLNISEDPVLFKKYLRHPLREPDYRAKRSHNEFVTSLKDEGFNITAEEIISVIRAKIGGFITKERQ